MAEIAFDWDQWNVQKNELKHGVSRLEAESGFRVERHQLEMYGTCPDCQTVTE